MTVTAVGHGRNGNFPPRRGKRQALALFDYLQSLTPPTNGIPAPPDQMLRTYAANHAQPGVVVLLSDLMHDGWVEGLRALASRGHEISVIHILAPDEINPEMSGDLKLIDVEDNVEVEITADYDLLSRYRQGLQEWQAGLRQFCSSRGIAYIPVETTLPLDDLLFTWLQRQGVLR